LIGAFLLLLVSVRSVSIIVSTAMIVVAIFSVVYRKSGLQNAEGSPSASADLFGYVLTVLLGVYGGFFSGGYVTILTMVFVGFFRRSFVDAVATTKVMNVFSSAIATGVFMWHGLIDYRLGMILGATMFKGAVVGARFAIRFGNVRVRRIFLTAVWALGLKALVSDIFGKNSGCGTPSHTAE
jgi:uncharacterized membrane protein YfcA